MTDAIAQRPAPAAGSRRRLLGRPATAQAAQLCWLGVRIDNLDRDTACDTIVSARPEGRCRTVQFANPHCLNIAHTDAAYRETLAQSDAVLPDGSGLRVAARIRGVGLRENLNGTDLFPELCAKARDLGLSIYLLGARPGIAAAAAAQMVERYPGLQVAGCRDGYFARDADAEVVAEINASGADLLFVAMGVPVQEKWIARHAPQLQVRTALGVGGLFDYYSGRIPRAPAWMRQVGVEWIWRLMQEPRRMFGRYVLGNPLFVWRVWREARRQRAQTRIRPGRQMLLRVQGALRRKLFAWLPRLEQGAVRCIDVAAAGGALVALSPLLALVAIAIRLESPGPVFFSQMRVGKHGAAFRFWKFRSMFVDAEARREALLKDNEMAGGVLFKMKNDPRITRIGRFIRRHSIDELPQLWNVVRGDMALVGPRPALPQEVAEYSITQRRRLGGMPGLTCTWQVSGRSDIPFEQQVELDLDYLHNAGLAENARLIAKTIPVVLTGRGAY